MGLGDVKVIEGKKLRAVAIMHGPRPWYWLVNINKPMDQSRMSVEGFDSYDE